MFLFQYLLVPFGLSLKHKSLDYCFTGLTVSIFGLFSVTTVCSLFYPSTLYAICMKACLVTFIICMFLAYYHFKTQLEKLLLMWDEICAFARKTEAKSEKKTEPKDVRSKSLQDRPGLSLAVFVLCFSMTYSGTFYNLMWNPVVPEIFLDFFTEFFHHHIWITSFYVLYWMFVIQFIHFELQYRYYSLLHFYNNTIEKFLQRRPNFVIKYLINEAIDNFEGNETDLRQTIYPLSRIIVVMNIANNLFNVFLVIFYSDFNSDAIYIRVLYSYCFLINLYFLSTQSLIIYKRRVQYLLLANISQWKNYDNEINGIVVSVL